MYSENIVETCIFLTTQIKITFSMRTRKRGIRRRRNLWKGFESYMMETNDVIQLKVKTIHYSYIYYHDLISKAICTLSYN